MQKISNVATGGSWHKMGGAALMAMLLASAPAQAQHSVFSELDKSIKAPSAVAKYGPDLFGDKVNLYNGSLSFTQTDVSLPGNSKIPVSVGRYISAGSDLLDGRAFGYWDLDIPSLYGVFAANITAGWVTVSGGTDRCTSFGPPKTMTYQGAIFPADDYWQGSFLHIPGAGDQRLLRRSSSNTKMPSGGASYPVVTSQQWNFSCLTSLANGTGSGEGFLAISPDGTKYRFDQMVSYQEHNVASAMGGSAALAVSASSATATTTETKPGTPVVPPVPNAGAEAELTRKHIKILPTLITDRYGNTVTYTYSTTRPGNLTSISASDGRTLTFTYGDPSYPHLITAVTDGTRTWTYSYYTTGVVKSLDTVTLPDNSQWKLAGIAPLLAGVQYLSSGACTDPAVLSSSPLTGSMTHPSGAQASFTLAATTHGRSRVPTDCRSTLSGALWQRIPMYFYTQSLVNKTLSGPGLGTQSWTYDYGPANANYDSCPANCPVTKVVSVTDPGANVTRHTFGNRYQNNEGKLSQVDTGWNGWSALRSTSTRYKSWAAGAVYPEFWGVVNSASIGDADTSERNTPVDQVVTTQQGVNFTWQADAFDSYARPSTVTRSDSRGSTRTETTAYNDNLGKWVLGQIGSVTESSTGKVMVSNTYSATTATLSTVSKFGLLQETNTYNSDGTLLTKADAASQTTTYSNYKAGIAQNIAYPNSTSESVAVNGLGQITSSTNGAGTTTTYGYDAMGRLSSVTPPGGDATAWNAYALPMVQVASDEYGLAAGHWRQTVSNGASGAGFGYSVTYYDALWRPVLNKVYDGNDEENTRSVVLRRYDHNGNTTFESYPQRNISTIYDTLDGRSTSYDALGRVTQVVADSELNDLTTTISYDSNFKKTVTNPRGGVVTTSYQTFDAPSEQAITGIAESYNLATTIVRDVFGKPLSITRGNGIGVDATRSYAYDGYGRLCKTIESETGATVQSYDTAGNVAWRAIGLNLPQANSCDQASVAAAKKISYGYDQRYQLKTTTYGDGSPGISRTYHGDGQLATVSSNGTVWTYSYNNRRLLTKERLAYASKTYDIVRDYAATGALSQLTYPGALGTSVAYSPNLLGQPTQVGGYAVGIHHHPNGAVAWFNYGNGVPHTMTQNKRGLPDEVRDVGVLWDAYTYDENGNVASITDKQESVSTRSMSYDMLDQLQTVNAPAMWGNMLISTDVLGNVRDVTVPFGPSARHSIINYDPVTNLLSSITGSAPAVTFGYDSQGNISTRGTAGFVFDQGNRLTTATGKASYVYDGLGRRVKTTKTDGTVQIHVYSQAGELLYSTTAVGAATPVETLYVNLNRHLLAEVGGNYVHTDGLGSPVARTNAAKGIVSRTRYEPYGQTAGGATPTVGFTGHVNDADTGLVYMQQRYYDPVASRFMSTDPVLTDANTAGSFNRYSYVNSNPYKFIDPDGRNPALAACFGGPVGCAFGVGLTAVTAYQAWKTGAQTVALMQSRLEPKKSDSAGKPEGSSSGGSSNDTNSGGKEGTKVESPVPGATEGEKTGGGTRTWSKPGGFDEANKDFDKMNPSNVGDKGNGVRVGILEDGRRVIVRPDSSDGRPTIEIQRPDGKRAGDKIRYD